MARNLSTASVRSRLSAVVRRLSAAVAARVSVDPRALAAFRIGLGALLIADLLLRSRSLTAFYTDYGVLPRRAFFSDYSTSYSLHALSGEPWAIASLFAVAGGVALALLVGYRTRLATVVSWLLLFSLHARNPMVLNSGDGLLRMLLFWSAFLPLGARWSVDAVRRADRGADAAADAAPTADPVGGPASGDGGGPASGDGGGPSTPGPSEPAVASVATMAILVQILVMYLTNAVHKYRSDLWMGGEAVAYVMRADQFTYHLGNHLAEFSGLLRAFTLLWVALLFASPLLLLLTGTPRAVLASLFAGMHLGMAVSIRVGLFPVIVVVGLIPFFQTPVWDALDRAVAGLNRSTRLARWRARLESLARAVRSLAASLPRPTASRRLDGLRSEGLAAGIARGRARFSAVVPTVFLVLILLSSAGSVGYAEVPDPAADALDAVDMQQSWQMFAPDPIHTTRWYVASGTLEDGTERDVFRDSTVDFDRPARAETTYRTARWRKYLKKVSAADNENHRSYLANYLCTDWNRTHETDVETVTIYRLYERIHPYNGTVEAANEFELIEYDCSGEFVQDA
ncbi:MULTISPECIES: HTTM domain-containing protein [Halorubrum]|uniref:Vitamin K-dependent gamma-carboxylase n=1 Tax=Halorubrum sodomense TaxID=35743 RepID=A0A1I6FM53_HALSD|nr:MULTISPECIES: HTTM domain-containing protein [Halorubrum]TKX53155.1 HTTM domain-containing protein [Halorubrum sp. SP3]TKX70587.1 HTTM domain-containing protein [Halorubrum sp. SP9]SFR31026.1 Vitamin K-dependent gamma-carboxylase [Halorubrum sodomense]